MKLHFINSLHSNFINYIENCPQFEEIRSTTASHSRIFSSIVEFSTATWRQRRYKKKHVPRCCWSEIFTRLSTAFLIFVPNGTETFPESGPASAEKREKGKENFIVAAALFLSKRRKKAEIDFVVFLAHELSAFP